MTVGSEPLENAASISSEGNSGTDSSKSSQCSLTTFKFNHQTFDEYYGHSETVRVSTGINICYCRHGNVESDEKVLLIMGLAGVKEFWLPTVEGILSRSKNYDIVSYDNRGMGGSESPKGRYKTSEMAEDAIALMDSLGWHTAHVVGISMGGMISLEVASLAPSRVRSLSLLVTSPGFPTLQIPGFRQIGGVPNLISSGLKKTREKKLRKALYILYPKSFLKQQVELPVVGKPQTILDILTKDHLQFGDKLGEPQSEGAMRQFAACLSHRIGKEKFQIIRESSFPILIVASLKDVIIHPKNSKKIFKKLQGRDNVRMKTFANAGHAVTFQCPNEIAAELIDTFELSTRNLP